MANYRYIYEKYFNTKIPDGWEVHHIDFDRENNNPRNLVALPEHLHRNYHQMLQRYRKHIGKGENKFSIYIEIDLKIKNNFDETERYIDETHDELRSIQEEEFTSGEYYCQTIYHIMCELSLYVSLRDRKITFDDLDKKTSYIKSLIFVNGQSQRMLNNEIYN